MKVTCQSCQARYTIADEKVRGKVAKIRCKKCGTTILVDGTDGTGSSSDGPVSAGPITAEAAPLAADAVVPVSPEPQLAVKPVAPAPEPVALRRPGRAAGTDLFGGARQDDAIATSAPASPSLPHVSETGTEKLTGARNENSVLFSLSALTSGNGPAVPGPEAVPNSRTADLRSLIGTNNGPSAPSKDKSKLDDIMNLGGGGLYSPALISPALAPPPLELSVTAEDASSGPRGKGRLVGLVAAVVLIGGGVTAFAMMKGGEKAASSTMSSVMPSAAAAAAALVANTATAPAPSAAAANSAPAEPATASATVAAAAQPAPEATPTAVAPGQPPAPKPEPEKKPAAAVPAVAAAPRIEKAAERAVEKPAAAAAPAPAPPPPAITQAALTGTASGEFDRAAAMSILSNTATASQACKKPDGPTGSGKVAVTYANNGVATTANIEGPPFAGTAVGGCIAGRFRATRIPPFAGSPVTVHKSFFIN